METFLFLFFAFIIDKAGLGPKWLQPYLVYPLVVMGFHSGLNGTVVDVWVYRTVSRVTGYVVDATNDPNVLIALPDMQRDHSVVTQNVVTMAVFLLICYSILCLLPEFIVKFVVTKQAKWLKFPGGKGLDWVLWPVAATIALLSDVPGHFQSFNSGFVGVVSDFLPTVAKVLRYFFG